MLVFFMVFLKIACWTIFFYSQVKDKVTLQLESVCEEAQALEYPPLQVAIAQTCSSLAHNTPPHLLHNRESYNE